MGKFINPKLNIAFKKIFGSDHSHEILISFLNAILDLSGDKTITWVEILDPYQAPIIAGMKESILDVRVKDQRGHSYVVEMQINDHLGFNNRILYNLCKAYVSQLKRGQLHYELVDVVAVAITDFIGFPMLKQVICPFDINARENPEVKIEALRLVFVELPKFKQSLSELSTTLARWLYFLKEAPRLQGIPKELAQEHAILQAFHIAERTAMTEKELEVMDYYDLEMATHNNELEVREQRGRQEGKQEGRKEEATTLLLRLMQRKFGPIPERLLTKINEAELEQLGIWSENLLFVHSLEDVLS